MAMGSDSKEQPPASWWRRAIVIGRTVVVSAPEIKGKPGSCAGCRRTFREHTDGELEACAAAFEETQPDQADC
jgi:hypothetical protein